MQAPTDRLVAETLAKSGLIWVSSSAGSSPVWHVVVEGVVYVVSGPGEQFCPPHKGHARVATRAKETRERLATFEVDVSRVSPQDDDWEGATEALRAARLNAPDDDVVARWREAGVILRLRPDPASVVVRGEQLPAPQTSQNEAAPPRAADSATSDTGTSDPATSGPALDRPELAAQRAPHQRVAEDGLGGTAQDKRQNTTGTSPSEPPASPRLGSGDDGGAAKVGP